MKHIGILVILIMFLSGCGSGQDINTAMQMRARFNNCEQCRFQAEITADYGSEIYVFTMDCIWKPNGTLNFTVVAPETIRGISGSFSEAGGNIQFDSKVLAFPSMTDGELSPVSAPWLLVKCIQSGYITACSKEEAGTRIMIDDSFADEILQAQIWLDNSCKPQYCEFIWAGRRILSVKVENFILE